MEAISVFIVEDETLIADDIAMSLEKIGFVIAGFAETGEEAIASIRRSKPDLVLLDINLDGDMTGIEVADYIKEHFRIPFIFLTSHSDKKTLSQVKRTAPIGFVLKPFTEQSLQSAIDIAFHSYTLRTDEESEPQEDLGNTVIHDSLFIKDKSKLVKVNVGSILWAEANDNYAFVITPEKKYLISLTLKKIEERLPKEQFYRVHRSYLVNLSKIDSISEASVVIAGKQISIGRTQKEGLLKRIEML